MLKKVDDKNNIIYGDLSKQSNLRINFVGKDNIVFFLGSSLNMNVYFYGSNAVLFVGDQAKINGEMAVNTNGLCYIGNNSTFGSVSIRVYEGKNIIIGNDCMFSWSIWLATCDQHLIYDAKTHRRANSSRSIYIGDHCWCSQEAAILKGAFVASGSILGAKSVSSGVKFSNTIYAGVPARAIKNGIFWSREDPAVEQWDKEKSKLYEMMLKKDFIFEFEKQFFLNPTLIENELDKLEKASEKLEFAYDYIYNNVHKNRFALFKDNNVEECKLYKDNSKPSFKALEFQQNGEAYTSQTEQVESDTNQSS